MDFSLLLLILTHSLCNPLRRLPAFICMRLDGIDLGKNAFIFLLENFGLLE
jgi:hypothetical protein